MAFPGLNASLLRVQQEWGGSNPVGFGEYYGCAVGIPVSPNSIAIGNFIGKNPILGLSQQTATGPSGRTNASCVVQIRQDGRFYWTLNSTSTNQSAVWANQLPFLTSATMQNWEVKWNQVSGDAVTSWTENTWINLTSNRNVSLICDGDCSKSAVIAVTVRNNLTLSQATTNFSMSVSTSGGN